MFDYILRGVRGAVRLGFVALAVTLSINIAAHADASVLTGTYSISGISDVQSCLNPADEGPSNESGSITLAGDDTGEFSGSGTADGGEVSISVSGVLFTNNSFNIEIDFQNSTDGESGTLTGNGQFDGGSTLHLNASGSSNLCNVVFVDFTLVRTSDSVGIPAFDTGLEVTAPTLLNSFVQGQPVANGLRARTALRRQGTGALAFNGGFMITGQAAGDGATSPIGAWAAYSRTDTKNDFVSTTFSSDRDDFLLGFDVRPNDTMVLGVSLGLERTDTRTFFNQGEQDTTSITVAPYIGALLTDWLSVDVSVGYSDVSTDQFRTVPGTATRVNSDVESHRLFANGNVAAMYGFGNLLASAQAGLLWARQRDDDFLESNGLTVAARSTSIGRLLFGGELAYTAGAFEPYVNLMFQHDFSKTAQNFAPGVAAPRNDDNDLLVALGLRYFGKDGLSASVQYTTLRGRRNLSEQSYSAYVRWVF